MFQTQELFLLLQLITCGCTITLERAFDGDKQQNNQDICKGTKVVIPDLTRSVKCIQFMDDEGVGRCWVIIFC